MQNRSEYFVVMISFKSGNEAVVNPNNLWSDVLDLVYEAACDGNAVLFVHHIHDGCVEDRTQEALDAILNCLADGGDPISYNQRDFVEHHFDIVTANQFAQVQ